MENVMFVEYLFKSKPCSTPFNCPTNLVIGVINIIINLILQVEKHRHEKKKKKISALLNVTLLVNDAVVI